MQLQPGTLILNGKFRIKRRLGGGAAAEVYEATQVGLDAPRALKILRRDLPGVGSTEVTEYAARFALEGRLQARLKGHPRIVQVYDTDNLDGAPVLIMEYCEGGSLETELDEAARCGQPLSVGRVVEVLQDMADGLAELHRLNCVHRDVKPGNVLLDGAGRAKIGDLGLAQVAGLPSVDRSGWDVPRHPGTPGYASPEHAVAHAYLTPRADIFALGVVGYRMLTGRMPDGTPPARRPQADRADVPDWLDVLLLRMLAFDPRQRPEDGGAVAEEIRRERRAEAERALARAAQAAALRARIEEALMAGRLVEADMLMDELLQLDADDLAAQTLARRVNRALVEEKQRLAREERLRQDEERARSKREDEERQAHMAEVEASAERKRQAEAVAQQQQQAQERQRREMEVAAAAEQKHKADEAAWQRREDEQRHRLATEARRQAAPLPQSAPALRPAQPPTGPGNSRRAVLIGAGALGALGLGWLATRGGGEPSPATPTPAPTRIPPTATTLSTSTRPPPTATTVPTSTNPPPTSTPAPTPTATPSPALQRIGPDRAVLTLAPDITMDFVRVPAGEFVMGTDIAKDGQADAGELPQHKLSLAEYWIGKTEVTVTQFAVYLKATAATTSVGYQQNSADNPVVDVTWDECIAFCQWASGLVDGEILLPSEAEWEKAARGTDGRMYPWGNEPPDTMRCNFSNNERRITPIGKYGSKGQSPYGCDDMAGNVFEWTRSSPGTYPYKPQDGRETLAPMDNRMYRGGSFNANAKLARCAFRTGGNPKSHSNSIGFRITLRSPSLG